MNQNKTGYDNLETILLLIEDDPEQRINLEKTALRYLGEEPATGVCVAENTTIALENLRKYMKGSPKAGLIAVMDYNMGLNVAGHKRPTEMLFYHDYFQFFLRNGGIVIIYSGYPEQVKQSPEIIGAQERYPNLALLIAEKSMVRLEDVFRLIKGTKMETIPKLRTASEKFNLDLGKIIAAHRKARTR